MSLFFRLPKFNYLKNYNNKFSLQPSSLLPIFGGDNNRNRNRHFISKNNIHNNVHNKTTTTTIPISNIFVNHDSIKQREYDDYFSMIKKNISMKMYMKNIYISSGLGFTGTILSGLIFSQLVPLDSLVPVVLGGIGSFASIVWFNNQRTKFELLQVHFKGRKSSTLPVTPSSEDHKSGQIVLGEHKADTIVPVVIPNYSKTTITSYIMICISNGLLISQLLSMFTIGSVLSVACISVFVTGGSTIYALRMNPEKPFTKYAPVLYGGLVGLIGVGLLSIGSSLLYGENTFTQIASSIDLYFGICLFTGLNILDTHNGVKSFTENKPDFLKVSINIILNTLNIFIRLLSSKARDNINNNNNHHHRR